MFKRKHLKQNKLKRILLKILNVYAYEKETLNIVNPDYKNVNGNLIDFNNKSFNFSRGYLNLTRKVKKLDIYFRYSPNNDLWNSTDGWKRIIPNINKKTLISVCLISLKDSIHSFLENNNLKISFHLIADSSDLETDNFFYKVIKSKKFETFIHKSKISGNRGSYLECCDQAEKADDLIFFIEDDYLFEKNCIEEIILTYSRISSILENDIVICPSDYPFFYDSLYNTTLLSGNKYKWRKVGESLLTYLFSKRIYIENKNNIKDVGNQINDPFEQPLHDLYKKINCIAPVNSLCYHLSRYVPAINENWKSTWDINFNKYKKIIS